ncbi:MAG: SDR family oxidoreductase [Dongiaceae bacterium]
MNKIVIVTGGSRGIGTAEEITHAILWLMSDAASYLTGAIIDVTGGR